MSQSMPMYFYPFLIPKPQKHVSRIPKTDCKEAPRGLQRPNSLLLQRAIKTNGSALCTIDMSLQNQFISSAYNIHCQFVTPCFDAKVMSKLWQWSTFLVEKSPAAVGQRSCLCVNGNNAVNHDA